MSSTGSIVGRKTARELAAYHEAGHAIVARTYGLAVPHVSIDGDGHGVTKHERCAPELELRIALAGIEAEASASGIDEWWSATDVELAARCGDDIIRAARLGEIVDAADALHDVREILRDRWAAVAAMAEELVLASA